MRFNNVLFWYIVLLLASCSDISKDNSEDQVHAFLKDYYETMSSRDWDSYRKLFMEKATLNTVWSENDTSQTKLYSNTIDEFIAQTSEGPDSQPIFEERMINAEIEIHGNLANAWVSYKAKFGSQKELQEWEGIDHFSLIEHQGQWKIVSLSYANR